MKSELNASRRLALTADRWSTHITRKFGWLSSVLYRKTTQVLLDGIAASLAFFGSYAIRFDGAVADVYIQQAIVLAPFTVALSIVSLELCQVYRLVWRWLSVRDAAHIFIATVAGVVAVFAADSARTAFLDQVRIPIGVFSCTQSCFTPGL